MATEVDLGQLNRLLSNTAVGLVATNAEGELTLLSPALADVFGTVEGPITEDEMAARFHLWDEGLSRPLLGEETPFARSRAGHTLRDVVVACRRPGHGVRFLRCNSAPLMDGDSVAGTVVLVQDATTERVVLQQQEELRHRLITTINHELRTPLTSLLGNVEMLADGLQDSTETSTRRALEAIAKAGERLHQLAQVISELAELESVALVDRQPSDVDAIVREVVDAHRAGAAARDIELRCDVRVDPVVDIDPGGLREALSALVDNALTFGPSHSHVVVHVCGDASWAQLSVADQGPGIPRHDHARLTKPFERGDNPHQPVHSRGLGLALATTVAAAHGGRLLLDSNHPQGLVATLVIPRAQAPLLTRPDPPPHVPGQPCPNGGDDL